MGWEGKQRFKEGVARALETRKVVMCGAVCDPSEKRFGTSPSGIE